MTALGLGLGLGLSRQRPRPRVNDAGNEVLFDPPSNLLFDKTSIWLPDFESELYTHLTNHPDLLHQIDPRKFEELIASIFRNQGFYVELTPPSKDGGYDLLAVQKDPITGPSKYLVECKRYHPENKVGVGIIRSLLGVVVDQQADKGILATTSFFTRGASEFQERNQKTLSSVNYDGVLGWLNEMKLL